jgi:hypothetical protein
MIPTTLLITPGPLYHVQVPSLLLDRQCDGIEVQ